MDWVIAVQIVGVAGLLDTMPPVLRHSICGAAYLLLVVVVSLASLQLLLPSSIIILAWHTKAIFNGTLTNVLVSAFNAHYLFFIEIVKRVKSFLRFHCLDFVVTQCCECIARLLPFYRAFFMDKMTSGCGGGKCMRRRQSFFQKLISFTISRRPFLDIQKFQQDYHLLRRGYTYFLNSAHAFEPFWYPLPHHISNSSIASPLMLPQTQKYTCYG